MIYWSMPIHPLVEVMMDTFDEMCGIILVKVETTELLELLNITTEDILDRFDDRVMMHQDKLENYLEGQLR